MQSSQKLLESFLNWLQRVKIIGKCTYWIKLVVGVLQGTIPEPLLINLYVKYIPKLLNGKSQYVQ